MLLKNYYKMCVYQTLTQTSNPNMIKTVVCTDGVTRYANSSFSNLLNFRSNSQGCANMGNLVTSSLNTHCNYGSSPSIQMCGVLLGNGTKEPTIDDYELSGDIVNSGLAFSCNVVENVDENSVTTNAVFTITNNNTTEVTISEIGLVGWPYCYYDDTFKGSYYYRVLVERTLLNDPVTIPSGGVGQITYTISGEIPTS